MSDAVADGRRGGVRYLRYKPGKAVFILYGWDASTTRGHDGAHLLCLTRDEAQSGPIHDQSIPTLLRHLELVARNGSAWTAALAGVTVRRLPDDPGLPALQSAWTPVPGDELCGALEVMLADRVGDRASVVAVAALPRHYKPSSRCVIEYRLSLAGRARHSLYKKTVYGKLFAKPEQAHVVDATLRRLTTLWDSAGPFSGWSPRPLGVVDALGMSLTDAAGHGASGVRTGLSVLRPAARAANGGPGSAVPTTQLHLAAGALARLHASQLDPGDLPLRTGSDEAKRALQRGELIANFMPSLASTVQSVAQRTASALCGFNGVDLRPAHGSYKRSQLLYSADGRVTVFDWDSMCVADPAIDLGCFLAHLRPSALWYARSGVRGWFATAADCWLGAYRDEMTDRRVRGSVVDGIIRRGSVYEAAMLLKIATRRLRRMNSPRRGELVATVSEADRCLTHGVTR